MNELLMNNEDMPNEIDFSKGIRGLHHIPAHAKVFVPASIEQGVWEYFSSKAEQQGIAVSELLNEALKRDIKNDVALK